MAHGISELRWLLDYELRSSARYRRFVSLVMCCPGEDDLPSTMKEMLTPTLRESDECFEVDNAFAILMGDTEGSGALTAVKRYKTHSNGGFDLRFGVAAYPNDGLFANGLIDAAKKRMETAKACGYGAVVATG